MNVPDDLLYSSDHEWIQRVEGAVRIGITDYAQDALGDVVYVAIPAVGSVVSVGDSFGEVESTKSVSDVYAPVTGTVTAVNDSLGDDPTALNNDPYGAGWLCEIELSAPEQLDALLDAAGYRALTEG
ncbi:MAG: glycine cleavage system protein GcvH [Ilumatobacteraceae bacterium]